MGQPSMGISLFKETTATSIIILGLTNVTKPLVNTENVLLLPLHMKLGLMKNFVNAADQNGS
jgi:hypothetical protein